MRTDLTALALVGLTAVGAVRADSVSRPDTRTKELPAYTLTLTPTRHAYRPGESPIFSARIHNNTGRPVWLVGCLDGSFTHRRAPRFEIEIQPPGQGWVRARFPIGCKLMNVLREEDVVEVAPAAAFAPLGGGFFGQGMMEHLFPEPGDYRVRLTYAAEAPAAEDWQGSGVMTEGARAKLARVPRLRLVSEPVTVRILPKE